MINGNQVVPRKAANVAGQDVKKVNIRNESPNHNQKLGGLAGYDGGLITRRSVVRIYLQLNFFF